MTEWLVDRVILLVPLIFSLSVHEAAHAWAAWRLGDDTAMLQGRMTLDPFAHVDPLGTFLLPLIGVPFGWARPVEVNLLRFRGVSGTVGMALVAAAGPASNLGIAAVAFALLALSPWAWLDRGCATFAWMNLALAVFNLLPIPPLDGSRIAGLLVPERFREGWAQLAILTLVLAIVVWFAFGP